MSHVSSKISKNLILAVLIVFICPFSFAFAAEKNGNEILYITDDTTRTNICVSEDTTSVTYAIEYDELEIGKTYTATVKLYNSETEEFVLDEDGEELSVSTELTAESSSASVSMHFTLNLNELIGCRLVVYDELTCDDEVIVSHEDPDDAGRSLYIAEISSETVCAETGISLCAISEETTLSDKLTYSGLKPGTTYNIYSVLLDAETSEPVLSADEDDIFFEFELTAKEEKGEETFEAVIDTTTLTGGSYILYNIVYLAGEAENENDTVNYLISLESDEDIEANQLFIPEIKSSVINQKTNTHSAGADNEAVIVNTMEYSCLMPTKESKDNDEDEDGREEQTDEAETGLYMVNCRLIRKSTGEFLLDEEGEPITFSTAFIPDKENAPVETELAFDASDLSGDSVIVNVEVCMDDIVIVNIGGADDTEQTVAFPAMSTSLSDAVTGANVSFADENTTIAGEIRLSNLVSGERYSLTWSLEDDSREPITGYDGIETYQIDFEAETTECAYEFTDAFDAGNYAGRSVSASVSLLSSAVNDEAKDSAEEGSQEELENEEISDEDAVLCQSLNENSVSFPKIYGNVSDYDTLCNYANADSSATAIDDVSCENLPSGTYKAVMYLTDKETGERIEKEIRTKVNAEKQFEVSADADGETEDGTVAELSSSSARLSIAFDASDFAGKDVAACEELYYVTDNAEYKVAENIQTESQGEILHFPKIESSLVEKKTQGQISDPLEKVTLVDKVVLSNIPVGQELELAGCLIRKETEEKIEEGDDSPITAETVVVSDTYTCTATLEFTLDATRLEGETVIAFDDLYIKESGALIGQYNDPGDESQSVTFNVFVIGTNETKMGDVFNAGIAIVVVSVSFGGVILAYIYFRRKRFYWY